VNGLLTRGDTVGLREVKSSSVKILLSKLDFESVVAEVEGTGDRAVCNVSVDRREAELLFKVRKALGWVIVADAEDIESDGGKPIFERSPECRIGLY